MFQKKEVARITEYQFKLYWHLIACVHSDSHEKQTRELNTQLKEQQKAKEATMREVNELKTQLKMVEESRDSVRRDLIEAHRKIREGKSWAMNLETQSSRGEKFL